jgi:hypothetical protein
MIFLIVLVLFISILAAWYFSPTAHKLREIEKNLKNLEKEIISECEDTSKFGI